MVKITKSRNQYRITIPSEIIKLKKWNEDTEVIFIPDIKEPANKLVKEIPVFLREVS